MARREVSGSAASMAAKAVCLLPSSDTPTITAAVNRVLIMIYIIARTFPVHIIDIKLLPVRDAKNNRTRRVWKYYNPTYRPDRATTGRPGFEDHFIYHRRR